MYDPIDLPEETLALKGLARQLVTRFQMPLEERMLQGETLTWEHDLPGTAAAKEAGLWGLTLPEEWGGANLSAFDRVAIEEEASRSLVPLKFGGTVFGGLLHGSDTQKEEYLYPVLAGTKRYAFAQTEPGGGADPGRTIRTTARRKDGRWVITGSKVFVSNVTQADFLIVVAVTDAKRRQRGGITNFIVDKSNPGLHLGREIQTIGGMLLHEMFFDECEVPADAVVGTEGQGFHDAQFALTNARLGVGAASLGITGRALEMMIDQARQRELFGSPLSSKQATQGYVTDSWMELHQARLALYNAAHRVDQGKDIRVEASMVKLLGTELAGRVLDRAVQVHGAAGVALDNPLAHWYGMQRMARLYEGPTEVHKYQVLARKLLA
jgi:acyl-CoA dehydrogenase